MELLSGGARILSGLFLAYAGTLATAGAPAPANPAEPAAQAASPGVCGLVQEFDEFNKDGDAYPVDVVAIDSSPRDLREYAFPLAPGPRSFEVVERIPQERLSPAVQRSLDESIHKRNLTIDVKANTVYVIGAKLLLEHWRDPDAYWAPVIYQESGKRCEPAS